MAVTWPQVIQRAEYQNLSEEEKKQAREQYFNEVVKPQLDPREYDIAHKEFIADAELLEKHPIDDVDIGIIPAFRSGLSQSASNLIMAQRPESYRPQSGLEEIAQQAGTLLGDLPFNVAGGIIGAVGAGNPLSAAGGALALPAAIKSVMGRQVHEGKIETPSQFGKALLETGSEAAKAFNVGALTGLAGRSLPHGFKTVGEIGTLASTGAIQEGRAPTLEEFKDSAKLIVGLKGASKFAKVIEQIHRQTGKSPQVISDDIIRNTPPDWLEKAKENPKVQEAIAENSLRKFVTEGSMEESLLPKPEGDFFRDNLRKALGIEKEDQHTEPIVKQVLGGDERLVKYGDPNKVIKQRIINGNPTIPVFEAEANIVKEAKILEPKKLERTMQNPIRVFEEMGKPFKEITYDKVKQAEHNEAVEKLQMRKWVRKSVKGFSNDQLAKIGTYGIAQREGGDAVLKTMGITEIPELTPAEMNLYNKFRGGFDMLLDRVNAARVLIGAEPVNKAIDYVPFIREFSVASEMGFSPIFDTDVFYKNPIVNKYVHPRKTPFRFVRRPSTQHPVELNIANIFEKYAESAIRHVHISPTIAKIREMIGTHPDQPVQLGDMAASPIKKYSMKEENPWGYYHVTNWLDAVAGKRDKILPNFIERGLTRINKNLGAAYISGNIRSFLIQPLSLHNAGSIIGFKHLITGIVDNFKPGMREFAMKNSRVLLGREHDISVKESQSSMIGKMINLQEDVARIGNTPLNFLDMEAARTTWLGAYNQAQKVFKLKGPDAFRYADDIITKTQGSAKASDIAPIQRNVLGRTATLFQTFNINQWNMFMKDVMGIGNENISRGEAAKRTARWLIAGAIMNMALGDWSPLPRPVHKLLQSQREGDDFLVSLVKSGAEAGKMLPIVGGGTRYSGSPYGATADYLSDVLRKAYDPNSGKSLIELVAKGIGIPGTQQFVKLMRDERKGRISVEERRERTRKAALKKRLKREEK